MNNDDRDLEALLRQALREQADRVQPAGDGLVKIQERAARRRRRMTWLRPGIAAVAAALAVLAAVGIPALLNRSGPSGQDAASQAAASSSTTAPRSTAPSATPRPTSPARSAEPTPSAKQPGGNQPTVGQPKTQVQGKPAWPYSNSRDATASASANPVLLDPATAATTFVHAFVSVDDKLQPRLLDQSRGTAKVEITRVGIDRVVCTVQLQQVSPDSAYVVTGAQAGNLSIDSVSQLSGETSVKVAGTLLTDPSTPVNTIYSAVLVPDGSTQSKREALEQSALTPGASKQPWVVTVNPPAPVIKPGIVAAWTVDSDGHVMDFSADFDSEAGR